MIQNQSWRTGDSRFAVADELLDVMRSRFGIFNEGALRSFVYPLDFASPSLSGAMRDMRGALRSGLRLMAGEDRAGEDRKDASISALYAGVAESDRELLDAAFMDAVDFYGFRWRMEEWRHLARLGAYLDMRAVGEGEAMADEDCGLEPLLDHALIRFMAELFTMDGLVDASSRPRFLSEAIDDAAAREWTAARNERPRIAGAVERRAIDAALDRHGCFMKAAEMTARGDSGVRNIWLRGALLRLLDRMVELIDNDCKIGPAVNYALSKYGARSSDCDAIRAARLEARANGWIAVWTPDGKHLGSVAERHDGLWCAGGMVADGRDSAVGLLIEERTGIMSVRGKDGVGKDLRIYAADWRYAPRDGRFFCEVWDEDHDLPNEGAIEFALSDGGILDGLYRGMVEEAQGRRVSIRDIVSADGDG